jgi:hypothetical protein
MILHSKSLVSNFWGAVHFVKHLYFDTDSYFINTS